MNDDTVTLSDAQRGELLDVAADAIRRALLTGRTAEPDVTEHCDLALLRPAASFVTLERDAKLLGCIGNLEPSDPLVRGVARHAVGAAFADPRLPPVTAEDYEVMSIKISVLGPLEPIAISRDDLVAAARPDVDGLVVRSGSRRATLLPAVWKHVRGIDEFLDVLWQKAGLRPRAWPADLVVERYTAEEFGDPGPRTLAQPRTARNAAPRMTPTTASE